MTPPDSVRHANRRSGPKPPLSAKDNSPDDPTSGEIHLSASLNRSIQVRRLSFIMLVRVIVFTLILGGTVAVHLFWGEPEKLGGPYYTFFFIFIASLYLLNIVYALLVRVFEDINKLAILQICCDLLIAAVLVNFTGGSDSAFVLLFLLSPIGAAVALSRRAAVITATCGTILMVGVIWLGYARMLPVLPGQIRLPWDVMVSSLWSGTLINGAAMFAVALLAGYLAEQLRFAAETMEVQQAHIEVQQAHIFNLAALNADIIRCLTTGLITVSRNGRILTMNQTAADILGVPYAGPATKTIEELAPEFSQYVSSTRGIHRGELSLQRGKNNILLDVSISPLTDHQNQIKGRIINFQDMTEKRRMEERVRHSEQLASLGRMAAGIAHEIRNPLASISGSLEMVRHGETLDPEENKLMDIAVKEIDRVDGLIKDMLSYARPHPMNLTRLDLGKQIHAIVDSISGLMSGKRVPIVEIVDTEEGLWVRADKDQMTGLLWNLVLNAWESDNEVQVDIRVSTLPLDRVLLEVKDNGSGISEKQIKHIFEPFYTTKDAGIGLGLAAVHRIAQDHDAVIEVKSEISRGTTFRISFPKA